MKDVVIVFLIVGGVWILTGWMVKIRERINFPKK